MNQDQLINTHKLKTKIMATVEKTPRSLEQLVSDFKASGGQFAEFNAGMSAREKTLFKGWLSKMRTTDPISN